MASVHRQPKSPYWYGAFYNADGTRSFKSTKQRKKTDAMRICLEWSDLAAKGRAGHLTDQQARKVIADIYSRANRETLPSGTCREYLTSWLETKSLQIEDSSMIQYRLAVNTLLDYLKTKADRNFDTISLRDLTAFRDSMAKDKATGTMRKIIKILRAAWRQAFKDGMTQDNVFDKLPNPDKGEDVRRPFTDEEIQRILAVSNTEWRGLVLFGYYTGMRISDIAALTWANIDLEKNELHTTVKKTKKPITLPLRDCLTAYLLKLPSSDDPQAPLFPEAYPSADNTGTLSNRFYDIMADAGIVPARGHQKAKEGRSQRRAMSGISFHSLRHSAASGLRNTGTTDAVAMAMLGHESKAIAAHYTKINQKALRAAVEGLPDITRLLGAKQ